jgi:hypothetical protein
VTGEVVRVGDLGDGLRVEAGRRRPEQAGCPDRYWYTLVPYTWSKAGSPVITLCLTRA